MKCALRGLLRSLAGNRKAGTAIEYGLIAALIAVAATVAMGALGNSVSNTFVTVKGKMDTATAA